MKSGLLSLALLGSPARGCFFRPEKDVSAPNALPGRMMIDSPDTLRGVDFDSPFAEVAAYVAEPMELSPREARVLGKRELRESCSKDEYFSECEQVNGSAKTLEQCLQRKAARSGVRLTRECRRGIEAWKQLLAETRPAANLALKKLKHEEAAREGPLKTDLGVSPYGLPKDIRDHLPSHHEKGHHHPPPPRRRTTGRGRRGSATETDPTPTDRSRRR